MIEMNLSGLKARLRILKSDRNDLEKPEFLKKYPHLDNDDLRKQLDNSIKELKELIQQTKEDD